MRFSVRSKAVEKLEDVKTNLITVRRIIFTPNVDLKDELKNTSIQITCLDEEGNVLKRVTSGDSGEVEDNENAGNENSENGQGSQNGEQGSSQSSQQGEQSQTDFALTISKYGTGTSNVKDDSEQTIASGANVASGSNVNISVVPAEGQVPTATLNGNTVELTENDGTYSGSFQMPAQASTLVINSGSVSGGDNDDDGLDKD